MASFEQAATAIIEQMDLVESPPEPTIFAVPYETCPVDCADRAIKAAETLLPWWGVRPHLTSQAIGQIISDRVICAHI